MQASMFPHRDKYHLAACADMATVTNASGPVAQWIRHRPTEPGIAGSSPAGVIFLILANAKAIWSHAGSNRGPYGY